MCMLWRYNPRGNTGMPKLFKRGAIFTKKEEYHAKVKTIDKGVRG